MRVRVRIIGSVKRSYELPLLALLTLLVRIRTFIVPPDDGNVGLYFYVARDWLSGWLPYTHAWEYKPPGLFALFAAGLAIFRTPALASAVLSAVAVVLTAFALRAIGRRTGTPQSATIGIVAALTYIFLSTEDSGLAGDAELYAAPFLSWAIYLCAFSDGLRDRWLVRALCVGLLAGLALQMKLTAIPVAALLAFIVAFTTRRRALPAFAVFMAGAALPIVPEILVYAQAGRLAQFYDANIGATLRRLLSVGAEDPRAGRLQDSFQQLHTLLPVPEIAVFSLVPPRVRGIWVLWAWALCSLAAIVLSREYYERQFFDLVAPLAILGALGAVRLGDILKRPRAVVAVLMVATFALHDYYIDRKTLQTAYERSVAHNEDYNRQHIEYLVAGLRRYIGDDRSLYVFQDSPMVYLYLDASPPTRYPFSADLIEPHLWPMLGFRGPLELQRILEARPHYVLLGQPDGPRDDVNAFDRFSLAVAEQYDFVADVDGDSLYRLAADPPGEPLPALRERVYGKQAREARSSPSHSRP